jgi:hypothetical protein
MLMGNENYRNAYETAASELEALLADQEKRENRILALRRTLNVLSTLCQQEGIDTTDLDRRYAELMKIVEGSLTNDIFKIVTSSPTTLTASEIREELNKLGASLAEQSNPLATIHAILNRLVESNRVNETTKDGKKAWARRNIPLSDFLSKPTLAQKVEVFKRTKSGLPPPPQVKDLAGVVPKK